MYINLYIYISITKYQVCLKVRDVKMGGSLVSTEDEDTDGASPDAASAFPSQLSAPPV